MKTAPLSRLVGEIFGNNSPIVEWEFRGAFTVVLNTKNERANRGILRGLQVSGLFTIFENYASCANLLIQGVRDPWSGISGVLMDEIENYFDYRYVESIVTADGEVLWKQP